MRDRGDHAATRRRFLRHGGALGLAGLAMSPMARLLAQAGAPAPAAGYGPLQPVRDDHTGLPLLWLPEGFRYRSFGWAGEAMADGAPLPAAHDGMGVVRMRDGVATVVRNHELVHADGAFGPDAAQYDSLCGGGTTTFDFDLEQGEARTARPSLSGTLQNCSGGVTPWHSWLSCEEFVSVADVDAAFRSGAKRLQRDHGFVFEVPADGVSDARPLPGLGQFRHEAAVVHARSGHVFLTEDTEPVAGFYRFVPDRPGQLGAGGQLQMLKVKGGDELRRGLSPGQRFAVEWVPIEHPERGFERDSGDIRGVQQQGLAQGAARFTRLEGCIATDDEVFFTSTDGGDAGCGQVFAYYPQQQELMLVYESRDAATLDYPDNVVVSPRGGLLVCQDGRGPAQHLYGLTRGGQLFAFARNDVRLAGEHLGHRGDFRQAEWAGACFTPDGRWLLANVYRPGFTVAITGPWRDGLV